MKHMKKWKVIKLPELSWPAEPGWTRKCSIVISSDVAPILPGIYKLP